MMNLKKVSVLYFSPTKNTEKVVSIIAEVIAIKFNIPVTFINYTNASIRNNLYKFEKDELLIFGSCVYAGRLPNKLLPFLQMNIKANQTRCIPVVTYGNRSFDYALKEAQQILEEHGCIVVGGAAIPSQHAFTSQLACGRPDDKDLEEIERFAQLIVKKLLLIEIADRIELPSNSQTSEYYIPLKEDGTPAKFLKIKPKTDLARCNQCGICANVCPLQSISHDHFDEINGICMKCHACIQQCPNHAKYFDQEDFLSHVKMLEQTYKNKKENLFYL